MIIAKEKAEELIRKYYTWGINKEGQSLSWLEAKQCTLIAVNEIVYNNLMEYPQHSMIYVPHKNDYWNEVKIEIEKL